MIIKRIIDNLGQLKDKNKRTIKQLLIAVPTALAFFLGQPAKSEEQIDVSLMQLPDRNIPSYDITYSNNIINTNFYVDGQTTNLDIEGKLNGNLEQKIGANILLNNDPVWNTIMYGIKHEIKLKPKLLPFLENDFKTHAGYQHTASKKLGYIYKAGQVFLGGEENLTGILKGDKGKFEGELRATGTFGGYGSFLHKEITWDHYKTGFKLLGVIGINDNLTINNEFNYMRTKFNTEKYFFVDDLKETNYGISLAIHPSYEDIEFMIFANRNIKNGKELNDKAINLGASVDFEDMDVVAKVMASIKPEKTNFILSGSKYLFDRQAMLEMFITSGKESENIYGLRFVKYLGVEGKKDRLNFNSEDYDKRVFGIIENQGYEKPDDFEEAIDETNTLSKIGNAGNYILQGPGASPSRNPEQFYENGYGDCDEFSWYRTYMARMNNYDNSWDIGYYNFDSPTGHAFSLVQDSDDRVYVMDNNHNVWLKVDIEKNASKEEMTDATLKQLSNYLAMPIEEDSLYYWQMKEPDLENIENKYVVGSSDDWTTFKSDDPGYAPIDTGLGSRVGMKYF